MSTIAPTITLQEIEEAADRIRPHVHSTPLLSNKTLNRLSGGSLFLKCENFQKGGAFKARGATNAVLQLSEEQKQNGVVTHSSGNHAQALALVAQSQNIPAYIVMPQGAVAAKKRAVAGYGATIIECEPNLLARQEMAKKVKQETNATFIHPYDNKQIIAGQGTVALEMLTQNPALKTIVVPIGGGGLVCGVAIAAKATCPDIRIIGVEPAGAADAFESLQSGTFVPSTDPQTVADGLRASTGELTWPLIQKYVDQIITVTDEKIMDSLRLVWERTKLLIEPSSATVVAALESPDFPKECLEEPIGLILSGGNVDLENLVWNSKK
ncbi:MAG: pyridoxal-phosphate dependent enzyme [Pirellulaceae bacterium]|nr:pyridoxal-phosphate dependent enzyme [Pirellulaceae bacterium]